MTDPADLHAWHAARLAQRRALRRGKRAPARRPPPDASPAKPSRQTAAQRQGQAAEDAALALLRRAGLVLLARNLRCRAGEIDLVMREGAVLVFVEVRHRANPRYGGAPASVDHAKQCRLARAAAHFLPRLAKTHWPAGTPACRFDVVAADEQALRWLRGAFDTPVP